MTTALVDPKMALEAANSADLVQKKIAVDAMRKRVGGGPSEEKKLREACEGFESIFLQKMWEQMRKNVKNEGYLHSKDEEAYQSMFDTELAKKMSSAGGIGLGDMLYEQLSQRLTNTSRTTHAVDKPLSIEPARARKAEPPKEAAPVSAPAPENLYSEPETEEQVAEEEANQALLEEAIADLAASRDPATDPANATYPMFDMRTGTPLNPVAERVKEETGVRTQEFAGTPLPERVSAPGKGRPSRSGRSVSRSARHARRNAKAVEQAQTVPATVAVPAAGAVEKPAQTERTTPAAVRTGAADGATASAQGRWPVEGLVVSSYGRQIGEGASGWNTGVEFAASAGTPVVAPMDGTVVFSGERNGVEHVVLQHENGLSTHYANVRSEREQGEIVSAGTEFASILASDDIAVATTAEATGRMRFEIRRGELALNPHKLLA